MHIGQVRGKMVGNNAYMGHTLGIAVRITILVVIIFLLSMQNASAVGGTTDIYNPNISVKVKYIAWYGIGSNRSVNINLSKMDISNIKNIVYVENYYSVDSYNMPTFYSGRRYETAKINNNLSFFILRPSSGTVGKFYSLVESIVVINGKRVSITWYDYTGKRINSIPKVNKTITANMTKSTVTKGANISKTRTNVTPSPTPEPTIISTPTSTPEPTVKSTDTQNWFERLITWLFKSIPSPSKYNKQS